MKKLLALSLLTLSLSVSADWTHRELIDPLTDVDTSYVYSEANGCSTYRCPVIIVRTDGNVVINFKKFMNNDRFFRYFYRFDKEKAVERYLTVATDGTAGFVKDFEINNGFVNKLKTHKKLVIVGYDYRNVATTLTFDLTGATEQLNKLGE